MSSTKNDTQRHAAAVAQGHEGLIRDQPTKAPGEAMHGVRITIHFARDLLAKIRRDMDDVMPSGSALMSDLSVLAGTLAQAERVAESAEARMGGS